MAKVGVSQHCVERKFSISQALLFLLFFFPEVNKLPLRRYETAKENNFNTQAVLVLSVSQRSRRPEHFTAGLLPIAEVKRRLSMTLTSVRALK